MSSSALNLGILQAKISNIQNAADSSTVYSGGVWSFKNSSAVASVTITNAGNVGIGTTSPGAKLDVQGDVLLPFNNKIYGNAVSGTSKSFIELYNGSTGNLNIGTSFSTSAITFSTGTSDTERARIDASGNVIFGTAGGGGAQVRWPYSSANASSRTWAIRNDWSTYGDLSFLQSTTQSGTTFDPKVTINASGNVGIGTTNPTQALHVGAAQSNLVLQSTTGTNNALMRCVNSGGTAYIGLDGSAGGLGSAYALHMFYDASYPIIFSTANNEKMRITTDGRILANNSLSHNATPGVISATGFGCRAGVGGAASNAFNINWTGSAQLWIDTFNQGTITVSSDYRIKKNIETQTLPALERVAKLRPVTYELADYGNLFKADGIVREGFIAHEVQEVIPSGAEGEKDEENRIQNLRVDAILAVAVKAIQELSAKVDAQAAEIEALKAK